MPHDLPRYKRHTLAPEDPLELPDDGSYSLTMTARDGARLMIDNGPALAN